LNAIAHKDYSSTTPIQISVYEDKMIIWNQGLLPENWTVAKLTEKHPSIPFNPLVSNTLFRSGYIEAWGRGTINMINECAKRNIPLPEFKYDFSGFIVEFRTNKIVNKDGAIDGANKSTKIKLALLLRTLILNEGKRTPEYLKMTQLGSKRTIERYIELLREAGFIEFKGEASQTGGYYLTNIIKNLIK
jgi:ATP-dependent DNA helicase RecG